MKRIPFIQVVLISLTDANINFKLSYNNKVLNSEFFFGPIF